MTNNIYIVTVATSEEGYMKWLKQSCKRYGTELIVLGFGKKWEGYSMRYKLLLEYIKNLKEDDIICFIDAYDVLMLKDIEILKQRFLDLKTDKIVCAIEKIDNLIFDMIQKKIWDINSDNKLINAGTYIGYVKNIKDMLLYNLEDCEYNSTTDDQILLNKYYEKNTDKIYLDTDEQFFYVNLMYNLDGFFDYINYNTDACFIHKPGNGFLNNFIKSQGYEITINDDIKLIKSFIYQIVHKINYHIQDKKIKL